MKPNERERLTRQLREAKKGAAVWAGGLTVVLFSLIFIGPPPASQGLDAMVIWIGCAVVALVMCPREMFVEVRRGIRARDDLEWLDLGLCVRGLPFPGLFRTAPHPVRWSQAMDFENWNTFPPPRRR